MGRYTGSPAGAAIARVGREIGTGLSELQALMDLCAKDLMSERHCIPSRIAWSVESAGEGVGGGHAWGSCTRKVVFCVVQGSPCPCAVAP